MLETRTKYVVVCRRTSEYCPEGYYARYPVVAFDNDGQALVLGAYGLELARYLLGFERIEEDSMDQFPRAPERIITAEYGWRVFSAWRDEANIIHTHVSHVAAWAQESGSTYLYPLTKEDDNSICVSYDGDCANGMRWLLQPGDVFPSQSEIEERLSQHIRPALKGTL